MFRVMVIEDEPLVLRSICQKIKSIEPDFKIAGQYENGEDALLEMDLIKPHVAITDIRMPVMDGLSFISLAKKKYPDVIFAIISGYQDFEYAKQAIRLGVSEYILKPPTNDNMKEFLALVKNRIMENQSLIESELLHGLAYPAMEGPLAEPHVNNLIREHFYHSSYILVYCWRPIQNGTAAACSPIPSFDPGLLHESEKWYVIPSSEPGEQIVLAGVHDRSEPRLDLWLRQLTTHDAGHATSCVLMPFDQVSAQLSVLLQKARKKARQIHRFQSAAVVIKPDDPVPHVTGIQLPSEFLQRLFTSLKHEKKQLFLNQLDTLLEIPDAAEATRVQWMKTAVFLLHSLVTKTEATLQPDRLERMEQEIEDAVWQANRRTDWIRSLKEIFSQLFSDEDAVSPEHWVEEVAKYLHNHYTQNIGLSGLAEHFNLNAAYLSRVFKREKQKSPIDYLIALRIEAAKRLIRSHPRLLFKDIAEQVGYADPYYFSKLFKQWTEQTLTEFKKGGKSPPD